MTTFVSLAPDCYGTASAVAVGDWLLKIMQLYDDTPETETTKEYSSQFVACFLKTDTESTLQDPFRLLNLLLSHHSLVFKWLMDIKTSQEQQQIAESGAPPTGIIIGADGKTEVRKTYGEALREVEDFFMLLMSMVTLRISDVELAGQAAGSFCSAFRSSKDLPEFRLRLLMNVYNLFPANFPYRFPIFVATLEYAAETNLFHVLLPSVKYIREWSKDWSLDAAVKRQVFLILANELRKLGKVEEAYQHLMRHVEYFQGESDDVLTQGTTISAAVELAEDAIKLPEVIYFDALLDLDAVKTLQRTEHAPLYRLLEIFCREGPKELQQFNEENPDVLAAYGLKYENCLKKIQLLSVASFCLLKKDVAFKQLSDALRLPESQAEEVVVQAIGLGLLDAKVDQINRVVHVRNAIQREFGYQQWREVLERLDHWLVGVNTLLKCIQNPRTAPVEGVSTPVSSK